MPMKTLSKPMKTRRRSEFARLGNASGTKARTGVANTGRAGAEAIMNLCAIVVETGKTTMTTRSLWTKK